MAKCNRFEQLRGSLHSAGIWRTWSARSGKRLRPALCISRQCPRLRGGAPLPTSAEDVAVINDLASTAVAVRRGAARPAGRVPDRPVTTAVRHPLQLAPRRRRQAPTKPVSGAEPQYHPSTTDGSAGARLGAASTAVADVQPDAHHAPDPRRPPRAQESPPTADRPPRIRRVRFRPRGSGTGTGTATRRTPPRTEQCRERNMDVELELQLQSGECPAGYRAVSRHADAVSAAKYEHLHSHR